MSPPREAILHCHSRSAPLSRPFPESCDPAFRRERFLSGARDDSGDFASASKLDQLNRRSVPFLWGDKMRAMEA
jgi:hypothetical protein